MEDKMMKIKSRMFYNFKEEEFGRYAINVKDMELLKEGCIENISIFKLMEIDGKKYYLSRSGFGYDEDVILKSNDWILL